MASKNKKLTQAAGIFEKELDGSINKIPLSQIIPSNNQPRINTDINIRSLAKSLNNEGLLQPIIVTKKGDQYIIIAGERRYHAARLNQWQEIECRVLKKNDKETYKLAVIENLQRENLDAFEESKAYKNLKNHHNYNDSELAEIIGKSRNYINEILTIADIPPTWEQMARAAGIISKNMLIQFSLAIKAGEGAAFIEGTKKKQITSVKKAKEFNRIHSPTNNQQNLEKSVITKPKYQILINKANKQSPIITIEFKDFTFPERTLENYIKKLKSFTGKNFSKI